MTSREHEAKAALLQLMALPDPKDLPPRRNHITRGGKPDRYRLLQVQPLLYARHRQGDREESRV